MTRFISPYGVAAITRGASHGEATEVRCFTAVFRAATAIVRTASLPASACGGRSARACPRIAAHTACSIQSPANDARPKAPR